MHLPVRRRRRRDVAIQQRAGTARAHGARRLRPADRERSAHGHVQSHGPRQQQHSNWRAVQLACRHDERWRNTRECRPGLALVGWHRLARARASVPRWSRCTSSIVWLSIVVIESTSAVEEARSSSDAPVSTASGARNECVWRDEQHCRAALDEPHKLDALRGLAQRRPERDHDEPRAVPKAPLPPLEHDADVRDDRRAPAAAAPRTDVHRRLSKVRPCKVCEWVAEDAFDPSI